MLPTAFVKPAKIAAAVKRAERALAPDVVRIRYNFGEDWTGAPSLYYRVLLSDKASRPEGLLEIPDRVRAIIEKEVKAEDMGLFEYFFSGVYPSKPNSKKRPGRSEWRLPKICWKQADHLARRGTGRPRQASLRRTVSTAYYAIFHLLIDDAVKNWKRADQRHILARAFEHGKMRSACEKKRSEVGAYLKKKPALPPNQSSAAQHLYRVLNTFIQSQEQRRLADYDNSTSWSRTTVLTQIAEVAAAFQSWKIVRDETIAQRFSMRSTRACIRRSKSILQEMALA